MTEQVVISRRYRGPPESGNGGYVSGLLGGLIGPAAEVTLRRPPPLDHPLTIERLEGGAVALRDGETLIAEGAPAAVELEAPPPIAFTEAAAASKRFPGLRAHIFPECFVCGPSRAEGDGLRIFAGWVDGREIMAAPWTPAGPLAAEDDTVRPEFVWASLDCPGGWSLFREPSAGRPAVLGRLAARILAPVLPGERCVVIGWPLGGDGRKLYSGTALFGEDGGLRAFARATWVRIA